MIASLQLAPVSVALKFGFLAVLYLFLIWVAVSSLLDLRRGPGGVADGAPGNPQDATGLYPAAAGMADLDGAFEPRLVVEQALGHEPGIAYDVRGGATLGRGDVEIKLEDPFASSRHARISRQGHVVVIEDLGSTNGTYLNDQPLTGPQPLHDGDQIRIGDSQFSYLQ
ncbi:MAG: FHA domain-containing protein [Actinomycetota bacterium]|nr:FHA domain-containing protein [Actinomycetota bacterium]